MTLDSEDIAAIVAAIDINAIADAVVRKMAAQQQPQAAPPGSLSARINKAKADLAKCQRRSA